MTNLGDIMGKLILFDHFISFKPVSVDMCGLYDFESYSLTKNRKMEFKIDYRDIVGLPMKIILPSAASAKDKGKKEPSMSYIMQLELSNNGYAKFHSEETKWAIENLVKMNEGICTVSIKIRPKTLVG
jgi:hypothetical protein